MLDLYTMFDEEVDKMSAEELKTRSRYGCCGILIGVILIVLCSLFMAGCTTTKVVTVEKVHTDTLREYRNVHDSIHVHDSVSVKEKGDTVWVEKWYTKIRATESHDTIYKARVDSVPVPYPVEKLVEKKLSKLQKSLMGIGVAAILFCMFAVVRYIRRISS